MLGLEGIRVAGVGKKRIAVTIAAAARGHRVTLLKRGKAAASHAAGDVLAAIFTRGRRRRCRHRNKCQRGERSGRIRHSEANQFEDELRAIERDTREYMRGDRQLSKTQIKKIGKRLNGLNGVIREAMERGRGGGYRR